MTEYLAPILTALALVIGAVGVYLSTRSKNTESYATGWQGYAKKLEERITALELALAERAKNHAIEIREKDGRIATLEKRVDFLEGEIIKYQTIQGKVEDAKATIKETAEIANKNIQTSVDNSLEEIKK